jgi:uncharacterized protein (TIGR02594 family)
MAKTKTRARAASAKATSKAKAQAAAKAPAKAPTKTAHARRAAKTAKPAHAANSRTPVAPVRPVTHATMPAAARPSLLADMLAPALRRIARRKRQFSQRARRQFALLRLSARRTQRRYGRSLEAGLWQVSDLRRDLRGLRRDFLARTRRRLRYANEKLNRKAERSLDDAQRVMHRTFRPIMRRVMPYRRAAIAGGVAALIVTLMSIGWASLFDQATAVPSHELIITVQRMSALRAAPGRGENPLLANIDLTPARPAAPAVVTSPPHADVPPPAPVTRAPAPVKAERHSSPKHRTRETHSYRHRISAEARNSMASVGNGADGGIGSGFGGGSLIAEARRYLGTNPTGRSSLWCGAFMDLILRKTGHKGGGNLALGYEHYGTRVAGPEIGAIAVMGRRGGGHVGVVSGIDANGNPIIVSGNHNHTVAEAVYPRGRIITYVMPN